MNENDVVSLLNLKDKYKNSNLYKNVRGIILKKLPYGQSLVLFLNDKIVGDYAVIEVDNVDLKQENIELPSHIFKELKNADKLSKDKILKKQTFDNSPFRECDEVELLVENQNYSKYGAHKGDKGVIAIDYVIDNSILVDFSRVDEQGNCYGDCISVKIDDLKKTKGK